MSTTGDSAILFAKYGHRAYREYLNPPIGLMRIVSFGASVSSLALIKPLNDAQPRTRVTRVRELAKTYHSDQLIALRDKPAHAQGHLYFFQGQMPISRQKRTMNINFCFGDSSENLFVVNSSYDLFNN